MENMSNQLTPEYYEFQSKYYSQNSLGRRFYVADFPRKRFEELALDPKGMKYDRTSVDEARAIIQTQLEGLIDTQIHRIGR